jgi:putative FmdB family regulatory protein
MPVYEYYCKKCDTKTEISHPINHTPEILCEKCYAPRTKLFGVGATIFKGNGWGSSKF